MAQKTAPKPPASVSIAQYLGSDDVTAARVFELLQAEQIKCVAFGSLGYTVACDAPDAARARAVLEQAIRDEGLKVSMLP